MKADIRTKSRVGIIVFASLILFAGMILVIGGKTGFFLARTHYTAHFPNSQGLTEGNQVRLAGVTVGSVRKIEVPKQTGQDLTIHLDIERRYQHLLKTDSRIEIKTIGLLGDKYLEVTPGSPEAADLEPGSEIPAYRGAELVKILAGSGDLVDNVVAISKSLKNILGRTEKGEGLIGELTSPSESGNALSKSLRQTIDSANALLVEMRTGNGLLPKLISDQGLSKNVTDELEGATASLHRILGEVEKGTTTGQGLIPALLSDPTEKKKFFAMVDSLKATADGLAAFSRDLSKGNGLVPKLLEDEGFAKEFLLDLKKLSSHLTNVASKLDSKEGTAGRLIADPEVSEAINDILVGVDQSKLLKWLVRNRQRAGIQKRYETTKATEPGGTPAAEPAVSPTPTPAP